MRRVPVQRRDGAECAPWRRRVPGNLFVAGGGLSATCRHPEFPVDGPGGGRDDTGLAVDVMRWGSSNSCRRNSTGGRRHARGATIVTHEHIDHMGDFFELLIALRPPARRGSPRKRDRSDGWPAVAVAGRRPAPGIREYPVYCCRPRRRLIRTPAHSGLAMISCDGRRARNPVRGRPADDGARGRNCARARGWSANSSSARNGARCSAGSRWSARSSAMRQT